MVKQGRYAGSKRQKQIKQRLKQRAVQSHRTIENNQVVDFVLVRYGLTVKKQLNSLAAETMQRMLQEMLTQVTTLNWSLTDLLTDTLQRLNGRVPWQFYQIVATNWDALQAFLEKEIPAVPLAERMTVTGRLTNVQLKQVLQRQLAVNFFLRTSRQNPELANRLTPVQINELATSLTTDGDIDWQRVAQVLGNSPVMVDGADKGTVTWLKNLNQLSADQ